MFEVYNENSSVPIVFSVEHASNYIPDHLGNLGLDKPFLQEHIAWDIGAKKLAFELSTRVGGTAIFANFSRLVIDPNRRPEQLGFIPEVSDGIQIKGNHNLSEVEVNQRIDYYYTPYHNALEGVILRHLKNGRRPIVMGIHSFTPQMAGFMRPWHIGFMWDKDDRLAKALMPAFEKAYKTIGHNLPYGGDEFFHTMESSSSKHGLAHTQIEIRQDLMALDSDILHWVDLLEEAIADALSKKQLFMDFRNI
ncbi:MAG: N-formylglutamate amidohydrolase [Sphingomonadales bacterium]